MQNLFLAELNFRENKITVTKTKCDYFRTVSGNYLLSGYFIGQKISGWSEWLLTPNLCVDMPSNIPNDMICSENKYISLWVRFGVIVNVCNVNLFIQKIVFGSFSKFMNLFFFIGFNKYLWFFLGPFLFSRKWIKLPWFVFRYVVLFCFLPPNRICLCSRVFFHRKSAGHLLTSNAIWSCAHFRKKTIVFVCLSKLKVNSFHTFNWINYNEMWLPAHHDMNRQIFAFVSNVSSKMLSPHLQYTHTHAHTYTLFEPCSFFFISTCSYFTCVNSIWAFRIIRWALLVARVFFLFTIHISLSFYPSNAFRSLPP